MAYHSDPKTIPTLLDAINNHTIEELKKLLALFSVKNIPQKKVELVKHLEKCLEESGWQKLWQELDELQQAAVAEVVHSDSSQFNYRTFQAKYGSLPALGRLDYYRKEDPPTKLRLFFYQYYIMPEDLKEKLKTFVPAPHPNKLNSFVELPTNISIVAEKFDVKSGEYVDVLKKIAPDSIEVRLMEKTAMQDLVAILRLIQAGKVTVSDKTRQPTVATINLITSILTDGDFYNNAPSEKDWDDQEDDQIGCIRAFSLPIIVQIAGFAELSGKKLVLTKAGEKVLATTNSESLKTAWKKWLNNTFLDEFRRINYIKGQTGKGKRGLTAVASRRNAIVTVLKELPINHWVKFDELFRYMQATEQTFQVSRYPENLYICEVGYGYLCDLDTWDVLEERYMLCFFFEYMATMGLIDVVYTHPKNIRKNFQDLWGTDDYDFLSRYDGLLYLRINALGAYLLEINDSYQPAKPQVKSVLQVSSNLEIFDANNNLPITDQLFLEQYTIKISEQVWQLEKNTLLNAIKKGYKLEDLQVFLTANTGKNLPATVRKFLAEIDQKNKSLTDLGTARIIECADATLAKSIANDTRTKKYCFLGEKNLLIVPMKNETKFRSGLQKIGYVLPDN